MRFTFHGAARSVTGSRHLLEANGRRILLDCGLVQGRREESERRNRQMGFDAGQVDAVVLSHAHIDHSGALPALVKNGFSGPIHATPATADLCGVMLRDSAFIQEKDVEIVNRREGRTGSKSKRPLYTIDDAARTADHFRGHAYDHAFPVCEGVTATFLDAGHILGAAMVRLDVMEKGRRSRVVFTGDLGRDCIPIIRPPADPGHADVVIMETTYGDREHGPIEDLEKEFAGLVTRVANRGGKILIPAFAVGRTQHIVYLLNNLSNRGRLPAIPVFVDSPLALETTEIFRRHPECWDADLVKLLEEHRDEDPFGFHRLKYLRTADESKTLNDYRGPAVIISASGMCESGRILHHLAAHLGDPRNVLLIVGYQAEGTLGRRLLEGAERVMILGREVVRRAEVVKMNALSAHAGKSELQKFVRGFDNKARHLFLAHGEPPQMDPFAAWARESTSSNVVAPELGSTFDV